MYFYNEIYLKKWIIYQYNIFIINYRFESNEFIVNVSQHINHPPTRANSINEVIMFYGQEVKNC